MSHDDALIARRRQAEVASDPHRFLREPSKELGRVGDFTACIAQNLAVLQGDEFGEPVRLGGHDVECSTQDLCSNARCGSCPGSTSPLCRRERSLTFLGPSGGRLDDHRIVDRIVNGHTVSARRPLTIDIQVCCDFHGALTFSGAEGPTSPLTAYSVIQC